MLQREIGKSKGGAVNGFCDEWRYEYQRNCSKRRDFITVLIVAAQNKKDAKHCANCGKEPTVFHLFRNQREMEENVQSVVIL